jgi:hypothetical protein
MSTLLKWLLESLFVLNALEVLSGWSLEASWDTDKQVWSVQVTRIGFTVQL